MGEGSMQTPGALTQEAPAPALSSPPITSPPHQKRRVGDTETMQQAQVPGLVPVPALPQAQDQPIRALNLLLQRMHIQAQYIDTLADNANGIWTCEAAAIGHTVVGKGRGKKAARREACQALLAVLEKKAEGE